MASVREIVLRTVLCACGLTIAATAVRGAVTGDLEVLVVDAAGGPIDAARVAIEGPALIGRRSATTVAAGRVRFQAVPPGAYEITASVTDLGTVAVPDQRVRSDRTTFVTVRLAPGLVERVQVRARSPLLDVTSTSVSYEITREMTRAVPIGVEYWDALDIVPATLGPVWSGRNLWVHGGTGRDNLYLFDGVNTTDPVYGMHGTAVDYETIDRHEVTTAGHMAEYGGVVGLTSNATTLSGGNDWSGGVHVYGRDASWGEGFAPGTVASSRATEYATSIQAGGPLHRDRVWMFTSFQKVRTETETLVDDGAAPRPDRVDDSERLFAKLSWQISPAHRLHVEGHRYDASYKNLNSEVPSLSRDQFAVLDQPSRFVSLRYTAHPADRLTLEAMLARFERRRDLRPQFPEAGPNHSFPWAYGEFGRYHSEERHRRDRDELRIDASWFLPHGIGTHDFKFGVYGMRTRTRAVAISSGGEKYYDRPRPGATMWSLYGPGTNLLHRLQGLAEHNDGWECRLGGVPCSEQSAAPTSFTDPDDWQLIVGGTGYDPTALTFDEPSTHPDAASIGWVRATRGLQHDAEAVGTLGQELAAVYGQDDWRLGRWTLRLGLRVESQRFRDSLGEQLHLFDTTVAPRLGVVLDPAGDGRSKVYAHFARMYDPLRDDLAHAAGQRGREVWQDQLWVAPVGDYFTWNAGGGLGAPAVAVAPGLRPQRTDELAIGYARALGTDMTVEITAIRRETTGGVESFVFATGLGDAAVYPQLQSGPTPASLGFADRNGDGRVDAADLDSGVVYCNMPGAGRRFDGLDIVFTRRLSDAWQMLASYSWADTRGTLSDDATYWGVGEDPDYDPRLAHNDGKLWYPDHVLKVYGSYAFPFGLEVGGAVRASSGSHHSLWTVTPFGWFNGWNGDPARISDTLSVDRDEFSEAWGIPASLPDGSRNPALDEAIAAAVPFELRAGRGAYENDSIYALDLRVRYRFAIGGRRFPLELFVDVLNATNAQRVTQRAYVLGLVTGAQIDPTNIGDRDLYTFRTPVRTQSPRSYALGMRVSF